MAPCVVAVCISDGGIPKSPRDRAVVQLGGLAGDTHAHEKHRRPERAVSIQDTELLEELRGEGFPVRPGSMGENLTVSGLRVQDMKPGDRLVFENGPVLELSQVRKPCYVLDAIDPQLKEAVVGRCGFLAKVVKPGEVQPGQRIHTQSNASSAIT